MCERTESRPLEAVGRAVMKPVNYMFPTALSVPASSIAKAMINTVVAPLDNKVQVFENKEIHQVSGDLKVKKKK